MNRKKLNWWAIAAVIILGVPVGFVVMGIIDKSKSHESVEEPVLAEVVNDMPEPVVAPEPVVPELEEQQPVEVETLPQPAPEPKVEKPVVKPVELTPEQKEERARREAERRALAEQKAEELKARKEAEKAERERINAEKAKKAEEERIRKEAEKAERERIKAEEARKAEEAKKAEEARKKKQAYDQLLSEVKSVVASGKFSPKVPEGCVVVINGKNTTNYQDFRNGVKLGSYSGINVSKIEGEGTVTKIYVTAKVNSAED
ncbi:MAG: hypothetical protein K2M01_07455 [Paramuribaculum sp.]|nr:hypothetical protein [Paramuribaculum sp.]